MTTRLYNNRHSDSTALPGQTLSGSLRRAVALLTVLLALSFALPLQAQNVTSATIEKMKRDRDEMQQKLKDSERLLSSTETDIKSQVASLNILSARLAERKRLLQETQREVAAITRQSRLLEEQITKLNSEYTECQDKYADACQFFQHQQTSFNPMLFLFSSENYQQLSRRARYIHEYSASLSEMAQEISDKRDSIEAKRQETERLKAQKLELQQVQAQNEAQARAEEAQQRKIVSQLQSKRTTLKTEIKRQQNAMAALNKEIDRQVQLAIEEARKATSTTPATTPKESEAALKKAQEDLALTGSFESNKGRLPIPITGPYLVVGNYGMQNIAGFRDVRLNNLGIDIQGESNAQARCIYDGVVSTIFQQSQGQIGVLVRHGSYISVYCNLNSVQVKKGDNLKTGAVIGSIAPDDSGRALLHFQLHKGASKLNPSDWLRR